MKIRFGMRKRLAKWKDSYEQRALLKHEYRKFKAPIRKAIFETVELTAEQKTQIDELFTRSYGKKIPYTWHRHYTAFTGNFDEKYFPELLFIPRFEYYMNAHRAYTEVFSDKNMLPMIASADKEVLVPPTYMKCVAGLYYAGDNRVISREEAVRLLGDMGEVFSKPTIGTSSGRGCAVLDMHDGVDRRSNKGVEELLKEMGTDFVIQERVKCHPQLATLHPTSCNTFRIMTYRWRDSFYTIPSILRVGQHGNTVDNAHAGGMFIAIDDDGTLHKTAFTEFNEQCTVHPDSGIVFENYQIDGFSTCREAALRLHRVLPQIGVINWDFTLNEEGRPVLIEVNLTSGGIWIFQMPHGRSAFGDRTEEILTWIGKMEKLPPHERRKYMFGNI